MIKLLTCSIPPSPTHLGGAKADGNGKLDGNGLTNAPPPLNGVLPDELTAGFNG